MLVRLPSSENHNSPCLKLQVALFLLCMPVIAAPLEALAVLGQSRIYLHSLGLYDVTGVLDRFRWGRHSRVLCNASRRRGNASLILCVLLGLER